MKTLFFPILLIAALACAAGDYSVWPAAKRPFALTDVVVSAKSASTPVSVKVVRPLEEKTVIVNNTNGTVAVSKSVILATNEIFSATFAKGVTQTNLPSAYFILDGDAVLVTGPATLIGK